MSHKDTCRCVFMVRTCLRLFRISALIIPCRPLIIASGSMLIDDLDILELMDDDELCFKDELSGWLVGGGWIDNFGVASSSCCCRSTSLQMLTLLLLALALNTRLSSLAISFVTPCLAVATSLTSSLTTLVILPLLSPE